CRTPDSPEGARVVAPRSPISPQVSQHHSSLVPQPRSGGAGRGGGGGGGGGSLGSITPPPVITSASAVAAAAAAAAQQDTAKLLKIRRFLGALVQFGQDTNVDIGDRVRSLVLSLASGGLTVEEFQIAVQEATNFPLRSNVVPFLKSHVPVLQREITILSRASKQTPTQYVRSNETSVMEYVQNLADTADIFLSHEGYSSSTPIPAPSPRANDQSFFSSFPVSKQLIRYSPIGTAGMGRLRTAADQTSPPVATALKYKISNLRFLSPNFTLQHSIHRDERDLRIPSSESHRPPRIPPGGGSAAPTSSGSISGSGGGGGGEEEWKNIHTMLTCISAMVEKTKRAISILQQRGIETHQARDHQDNSMADMKRQTEEKIAEFRRSAEESVNQVKRQAVIEIQRAVAAAEARTIEMFAQERLKMEKMFAEIHRGSTDPDADGPTERSSLNSVVICLQACWNCGRKANETCSGCNLARYCGSFCQHKDWDQHHQVCGTSRAENAFQKHAASARAALSSRSTTPQQSQSSNSTANGTAAVAK
ncbi:AAEL003615-PA, partial [Aedes aegypti]